MKHIRNMLGVLAFTFLAHSSLADSSGYGMSGDELPDSQGFQTLMEMMVALDKNGKTTLVDLVFGEYNSIPAPGSPTARYIPEDEELQPYSLEQVERIAGQLKTAYQQIVEKDTQVRRAMRCSDEALAMSRKEFAQNELAVRDEVVVEQEVIYRSLLRDMSNEERSVLENWVGRSKKGMGHYRVTDYETHWDKRGVDPLEFRLNYCDQVQSAGVRK